MIQSKYSYLFSHKSTLIICSRGLVEGQLWDMRPCNAGYVSAAKHYSARSFLLVKAANGHISLKKIMSGRPWLEIGGNGPASLRFHVGFSQYLQGNLGLYVTLGYQWFRQHPLQQGVSWLSHHSILYSRRRWERLQISHQIISFYLSLKPSVWSVSLRFPITNFLRISCFHSQSDVPYSWPTISKPQPAKYKTHIIKEIPKEIL
jgi:hypothetical protein